MDDSEEVRTIVRAALEASGLFEVVGEGADGGDAITQAYRLQPDLLVLDTSMPTMDGLEALSELVEWPGSRVLLTGQADEQIAVRAFNRGLIDQFIPKQSPDIAGTLVAAVNHLLTTPNARHAQIWRAALTPEQNALLRTPYRERCH